MDVGYGQLGGTGEGMGCGLLTGATRFGLLPELLIRIGGEIPGGCGLFTSANGCGLLDDLEEGQVCG